jgi:AAA domain
VWPSMHVSGKQYRWQVPPSENLSKLPVELFRLLSGPSTNGAGDRERFDSSVVWEGIPEGQRDDHLFRYACQLRALNSPLDVAQRLALEAAARCRPPFPQHDALKKVEQAYKYEPGRFNNGESIPQGATSDQAAKHHFTLVSAKDVLAAEDVETSWIWDGILPAGGMSLVVAKPKVGKTTLAFDLAVSVARGSEFLNRKTEQGMLSISRWKRKRARSRRS